MRKKGYALITDALIALVFSLIIITVLFNLSQNISYLSKEEYNKFLSLHYWSEDALDVMNKQGILDDIGYNWALSKGNRSSIYWKNATNISKKYLEKILPRNVGYKLLIEGQEICNSSWNPNRSNENTKEIETHANRLLVGYGANVTILGKTARAALTNIKEKITSEYAYFGGFVGQGNISRELFLPSDANVLSAYIEVNAGDDFDLFINGAFCKTFSPTGEAMEANVKDDTGNITSCRNLINNRGSIPNIFEIRFRDNNISKQYIGGGFIEVTYNTTEMDTDVETGYMRFYFPKIHGIINYYSSLYVPGWVNTMDINVSFINNFTTFLTIGDETVFRVNGSSSIQNVYNSSAQLIDSGFFAQSELSEKTIPIRLGTEGLQYVVTTTTGNADVVLITDVSGSMDWRIGYSDSTAGTVRPCCPDGTYRPECLEDPTNPLFLPDTQRLALAKCLDKYFVDTILNTSGNRVALVHFSTSGYDSTGLGLIDDNSTLHTAIDNYNANGGTCICCAINKAYEILNSDSNATMNKYIIVMTDGITGFTCEGAKTYFWEGGYWRGCTGIGTSGHYVCNGNPTNCGIFGGSGTGCSATGCSGTRVDWWEDPYGCTYAMNNANWSSWRAHNDLNSAVYSIGFGNLSDCCAGNWTLTAIAESGNGSVYISSNATELFDIYKSIAESIVSSSYVSQTITVSGGTTENVTNSTLYGYPESYIEFRYIPYNVSQYGKISITKKSDRFNEPTRCIGNISIPENVTVSRLKITSYSGEHWTHYLNISNSINFDEPYKLWDYGMPYIYLGDPYIINIRHPWTVVNPGENNYIGIRTGDSPTNDTNCSADDRAIYTVRVSSILGYGDVFPVNEGCLWDIEFSNGNIVDDLPIPAYYNGVKECSYTSSNQSYDDSDAITDAVFRLLRELDIEDDGIVDIDFDPDAIKFETTTAGGVRSLWGPIKITLILWI